MEYGQMATGKWVRHGFVDSDSVSRLSDWAHRVYSNLLLESDYAGRLDGRPEILRSRLFPLGTTRRVEDVQKAIKELVENRLIITYEFAGKPYIQLTKVEKTGMAKSSEYPWRDGSYLISYVEVPVRDADEGQRMKEFVESSMLIDTPSVPHADPIGTPPISKSQSQSSRSESKNQEYTEIPRALDSPEFREAWAAWERHRSETKKKLTPTAVQMQFKKLESWGIERAVAAIQFSIGNGYQGIFEPNQSRGVSHGTGHSKPAEYTQPKRELPILNRSKSA